MDEITTAADPVSTEIRVAMLRRGRTQGELAEHLGIGQASVSDRITGKSEWRIGELRKAAEFLGMPLVELITGRAA